MFYFGTAFLGCLCVEHVMNEPPKYDVMVRNECVGHATPNGRSLPGECAVRRFSEYHSQDPAVLRATLNLMAYEALYSAQEPVSV